MRTQSQRLGVLGVELTDNLGPQHAGSPHLGNLHELVHAHAPEERQTRREVVDAHARADTGAQILQSVGQRIGQLNVSRSAGFLHVVAGDTDTVELGHVLRGILEDVGDNLHRRQRRIDIGVAHHELLEDVVLDGALQLVLRHSLFLGGDDIERKYRQHSTVHGHGNRHLTQVDLVKQNLHVEDAVDGHTGLAHVAHHALMVRVVATVGSQVESATQALLTGGYVATVEGVTLLGGRETGILTDGPRTHHIHCRIGATQERGDTGGIVQVLHALQVLLAVGGLHINLLGRLPILLIMCFFLPFGERFALSVDSAEVDILKVRSHYQTFISLSYRIIEMQI